jgi:hypothetical protein
LAANLADATLPVHMSNDKQSQAEAVLGSELRPGDRISTWWNVDGDEIEHLSEPAYSHAHRAIIRAATFTGNRIGLSIFETQTYILLNPKPKVTSLIEQWDTEGKDCFLGKHAELSKAWLAFKRAAKAAGMDVTEHAYTEDGVYQIKTKIKYYEQTIPH